MQLPRIANSAKFDHRRTADRFSPADEHRALTDSEFRKWQVTGDQLMCAEVRGP